MAAGLASLAVPTIQWGAQLLALWGLPHGRQELSRLGEPTAYNTLPYDVLGYWLPGVLFLFFGIRLILVVGRSWLSMSLLGVLAMLGAATASLATGAMAAISDASSHPRR